MSGPPVAVGRKSQETAGEEKARVLPGAVVVEPSRALSSGHERLCGGLVHRKMRAADQGVRRETAALQESSDSPDVAGLAAVGRANEGDVARTQPEPIAAARLEERKSLKRLSRRSKEDRKRRIAPIGEQAPVLIDHRSIPPMA
jgi:hypothetical protein